MLTYFDYVSILILQLEKTEKIEEGIVVEKLSIDIKK